MKSLTEIVKNIKKVVKKSGKGLIVYSSMLLALTDSYACGGEDNAALLAEADAKCKQWYNENKCVTKGASCNELAAIMYTKRDNWDGAYGRCVNLAGSGELACAPVCDYDGKCLIWQQHENVIGADSIDGKCSMGNNGGGYYNCKAGSVCGESTDNQQ